MSEKGPATGARANGQTRRRPRRTEEETRELAMQAAVERVAADGIRANLELSMEESIAAADIPRATAYRLWPSRDMFTADVLDRLARGQSTPTLGVDDVAAAIREVASEVGGEVGGGVPADDGIEIVGRIMERIIEIEFDLLVASPSWRAFLAYEAVLSSLADPERRRPLLRRLDKDEERITHGIAALYGRVARALGLAPRTPSSLVQAAHASRVLARGLVANAVRETSTQRRRDEDRACLRASTGALIRAALEPTSARPPRDWPERVLAEIRTEFDGGDPAGA